jgi:enoyl-CoA hydratase/carnithine racemase
MPTVRAERHPTAPHTQVITLDRPEARNAYSDEMIDALIATLDAAEDDDDVRVVILTGTDPAFSAGGDVKAMRDRSGMFAGDAARLRTAYQRHIQRVPRRLIAFDKPVIAAVNGSAIGAGLDLACMADLRIASERATFGSTFVKIGLVPGDGGAYFLARAIGHHEAARMVLTGRILDAGEARRLGLVLDVVPHEELLEAAGALAAEIAANAPVAVRLAKQALSRSWDLTAEAALELAATYQGIAQRTADHEEGVAAILERRPPTFRAR